MIKKYYDSDCDIKMLDGKTIAIMGFGSQGHAHAMNLKDSGCNVIVGLRPGSRHEKKAKEYGLKVMPVAEAAKNADIVMMLVPDEICADIYDAEVVANRMLGFVNAPSLMQLVVARCLNESTAIDKYDANRKLLYPGTVTRESFRKLGARLIDRFFSHPSYYCIDGAPVFSIYDLGSLLRSFGGVEEGVDLVFLAGEEGSGNHGVK